jgi:hypothetical protein
MAAQDPPPTVYFPGDASSLGGITGMAGFAGQAAGLQRRDHGASTLYTAEVVSAPSGTTTQEVDPCVDT